MKITVIGGAGVRGPLLVGSFARRAKVIGLDEVAIYDIDPRKVGILVPVAQALLAKAGHPFRLTVAPSAERAFDGADAVITTIREGFEEGRARDERLCVEHGVIGQETTGPAGFAFACRSIPALLNYARRLFDRRPGAWLINFTNPAGMTTEALRKEGFERTVGICDSAEGAKSYAADALGLPKTSIETRVAGLNHLSFTTSLKVGGAEKLPALLANEDFVRCSMPYFSPGRVAEYGCWLNEYLYYYLEREAALCAMLAEKETRGEKVLKFNATLLTTLEEKLAAGRTDDALDAFFAYQRRRNASYMEYARREDRHLPSDDGEGYAGVALDFLEGVGGGATSRRAFCVPNDGALPGLEAADVVEVTCELGQDRLRPLPTQKLPPRALDLIATVKDYERLGVEAVRRRSIEAGLEALGRHPLIGRARTEKLFAALRAAAPRVFEAWR